MKNDITQQLADALKRISKIGHTGMPNDFNKWVTSHDLIAKISDEALAEYNASLPNAEITANITADDAEVKPADRQKALRAFNDFIDDKGDFESADGCIYHLISAKHCRTIRKALTQPEPKRMMWDEFMTFYNEFLMSNNGAMPASNFCSYFMSNLKNGVVVIPPPPNDYSKGSQ